MAKPKYTPSRKDVLLPEEGGPIPLEVKNGKVTKWVCRCGKSAKLPECDWTCTKPEVKSAANLKK